MEEVVESLKPISRCMDRIQSILALDFLDHRLVDVNGKEHSLGRVGIIGCFLGIGWGIHVSCGVFLIWVSSTNLEFFLDPRRVTMAWTWCFYITAMCTFHLLEFFVTAFSNPTVADSDSFLVNHSKAYTVAAIIASTEFLVRFCFGSDSASQAATTTAPNDVWWMTITISGIVMVITSQIMRSCAMMKCGESFNHYIQTLRKENRRDLQLVSSSVIYGLLLLVHRDTTRLAQSGFRFALCDSWMEVLFATNPLRGTITDTPVWGPVLRLR
jgi:hypothetical protein